MSDQRIITTLSGTPATDLGLGAQPGQDSDVVGRAREAGINYFFFYSLNPRGFIKQVASLARAEREDVIIATGSGARTPAALRAAREKTLTALGTDLIDLFFAEYIHPDDEPSDIFGAGGVLDELQRWKSDGTIRLVGATAHDRTLAAQLAADPRVDVLMHRFNMAHRKAITEVFPAVLKSRTPLVAFTATRWGTLLEPSVKWPVQRPTAVDCYRYCLAQPAVSLVLTAPQSIAELETNLTVLDSPPMNAEERDRWHTYGDLVYGTGTDDFETQWP